MLAFFLFALSFRAGGASLELLYIDANVGTSSGGHTALKIGDSVYHFQNEQGHSRLTRDGWKHFRFVYNDIDNRSIHVAGVRVDAAVAERVEERLRLLFLVQNRHAAFLDALDRDTELLHRLARDEPYELPGIGFFARRAHEAPPLHGLGLEISRRLGPGFLEREDMRVRSELAALAYAKEPVREPPPEEDRYPQYPPTFSERAENLYTHRYALDAIREEWPLRDGILIDAGENEHPGGNPVLSESERRWLAAYRRQLADAIFAGLQARYTGSGAALLLAMARFLAVSQSLVTNRLLVLDTLPAAHRAEMPTYTEARRRSLLALLYRSHTGLARVRREIFALAEPDEAAYNRIEHAASQIAEIRRGLASGLSIRFLRRAVPPAGWGFYPLPAQAMSSEEFEEAEQASRVRSEEYRGRIRALYPYDLIGRNCVTELVRAVNSAFDSPLQVTAALGGYLEPGEAGSFVPHRFFELALIKYRVEISRVLPSYRNRMLRQLAERGEAWSVLAAESSPWTSSFYEQREGDTLFALFTEDVFWQRPLYGAINLVYGLAGTGVGVLAAPFDRGQLLKEGLRGALFSLPELGFWNIRKGSFDGIRGLAVPDSDAID